MISNTVLFGISTFGARFLTFLLTPFYTRVLSSTEYGITDLLIQTGNLIIPIASVGIANGVIRYGLERSSNKASVFTTGILVTLAGFFVLALASPLLDQLTFLSGYVRLVLLYVLAANLHSICNQFARALGHVRLFALDGILRTVLTILLNILLLAVFPLGAVGYVLANVLADGIAAVFVFSAAKEWRYLRLSSLSRSEAGRMLRYSAPLVPSTLCSWIINISDRYLIALLIGSAATGIYAVSNKVPNILMNVASIFTSAWQLSALAEQPKAEKERFFSNVYAVYSAIAFVTASGVILTARLSTRLLAAPEYYEAWRYVPVLTLATTFACLGSFLSSIYNGGTAQHSHPCHNHARRRLQSGGEFFPDSALGLYGRGRLHPVQLYSDLYSAGPPHPLHAADSLGAPSPPPLRSPAVYPVRPYGAGGPLPAHVVVPLLRGSRAHKPQAPLERPQEGALTPPPGSGSPWACAPPACPRAFSGRGAACCARP